MAKDTTAVATAPAKTNAKKGVKKVKAPKKPYTADVKGQKGAAGVCKEGADGIYRTRLTWNGHSLSALLKWVGANGGGLEQSRALVAALGFADYTSASTVSCQTTAGYHWRKDNLDKNGVPKTTPHHQGAPADLDAKQAKAVRDMAGM